MSQFFLSLLAWWCCVVNFVFLFSILKSTNLNDFILPEAQYFFLLVRSPARSIFDSRGCVCGGGVNRNPLYLPRAVPPSRQVS